MYVKCLNGRQRVVLCGPSAGWCGAARRSARGSGSARQEGLLFANCYSQGPVLNVSLSAPAPARRQPQLGGRSANNANEFIRDCLHAYILIVLSERLPASLTC